jgi:hypothetical protein
MITDAKMNNPADPRAFVTTVAEVLTFDVDMVIDGHRAGLQGEPMPDDRAPKGFWHGWLTGNSKRTGEVHLWQRLLAEDYARHGSPMHPGIKKRLITD